MANKITDMSKIRKVIKYHLSGSSKVFISNYLSLSRNTVKKYISQYEHLNLDWGDLDTKSDSELEQLFNSKTPEPVSDKLTLLYSFFPSMERELKKVGVTVLHQWERYIGLYPDGFQRTQFRVYYKEWSGRVNPVMHMHHKSGDKMYVDYAGKRLQIVDKISGEVREVEFFVAILGASQYTYAEASNSQQKGDFVQSIENALHFFQGVPAAIVPDNLKSAVIKSSRFEPNINETLADFAEHYQTTILPARAYKPRDKSLVEGAVKILYRRIYTHLGDQIFYSLKALNQQIWKLLEVHNQQTLTGRSYSRHNLFLEDEKEKLKALPTQRFELKYQSIVTVMKNGHVQLSQDKTYYSVPYQYIKKKVKILYTASSVEIYYKYNRIALHKRCYKAYVYTTITDHLASSHRFVAEWSAERFIQWASNIDPVVSDYISKIIDSRNYPEQAYKSCLGILNLEKKVGKERLIKACKRGLEYEIFSYKSIQKILENNLDKVDFDNDNTDHQKLPEHNNIRGKQYYN